MTIKRTEDKPWTLTDEKLKAYRSGFHDGNEGNYFPCSLDQAQYDRGFKDGKKYGPRKGKPWSLAELLKLAKQD